MSKNKGLKDANATAHHPKCHTFIKQMPFMTSVELWHFG